MLGGFSGRPLGGPWVPRGALRDAQKVPGRPWAPWEALRPIWGPMAKHDIFEKNIMFYGEGPITCSGQTPTCNKPFGRLIIFESMPKHVILSPLLAFYSRQWPCPCAASEGAGPRHVNCCFAVIDATLPVSIHCKQLFASALAQAYCFRRGPGNNEC